MVRATSARWLGLKIYCARLETPRRLLSLAQRRDEQSLGSCVERDGYWTEARLDGRVARSGGEARREGRVLLLALRMVQSAVAQGKVPCALSFRRERDHRRWYRDRRKYPTAVS